MSWQGDLVNPTFFFVILLSWTTINFATLDLHVLDCVVPENIHTSTMEGIGNSRAVGGSKAQEIPEGWEGGEGGGG